MSRRLSIIGLVFLGYLLFGISATAVDPLVPLFVQKFGVGFDKIGIVLLVGSVSSVVSNIFFGRLCDRIEIKWTLLFGVSLLFLGFLLFGTLYNFTVFVIIVILIHMGYGSIWPSLCSFIANSYPDGATVIFVKADRFYYLGAALCPLFISLNLFLDISPRVTFLLFAGIFLILFFVYLSSFPISADIDEGFRRSLKIAFFTPQCSKQQQKITEVFNIIIVITGFVLLLYASVLISLSIWLTTYLESFEIQISYGSVIVSAFWFFAIVGLFLTNMLLRRSQDYKVLFLTCIIGTLSLGLFTFLTNAYLKISFLILVAVFLAGIYALCLSISIKQNPKASGTISGFCIAMGVSGSIILQPFIGYIAEYKGREYVAYIILGVALLGLILVSILYSLIKKLKRTE